MRKDYCFKLELPQKQGNSVRKQFSNVILRKFYTVSGKPTHCKCKIQLLFNEIRFYFGFFLTSKNHYCFEFENCRLGLHLKMALKEYTSYCFKSRSE